MRYDTVKYLCYLKGDALMYEEKIPEKKVKKAKKKAEKKFFKETGTKTRTVKEKKTDTPKKEKTVEKTTTTKEKTPKKILHFKADYVSVLIKLGIFLVVAFVVIFVVTKIKNATSHNNFDDNMERMREVGYTYFKVDTHRPTGEKEEIMLTLKDMIDGSLIEELKEDETVCSSEESYVSLVKETGEHFNLNVYLKCGEEDKSATYDVTFDESTESEDGTILYELERTVTTGKYTCPEGYINSGRYCIGASTTETLPATPKYRVIPEKNRPAIYKSSDTEYEYVDPIVTEGSATYRCSSGYTLSGSKCTREVDAGYRTENIYSCPNGGTLSGARCVFTMASTNNTTCPSGYSKRREGNTLICYRYEAAEKTVKKNYFCASGYTMISGNKCVKTVDAIVVDDGLSYSCPAGYTQSGSGKNSRCYKKTTTEAYYYCEQSDATLQGDRCITPAKTQFITYSCPSGYSLEGSTCYKENSTDRILATENETPTSETETIWSKEKEVEGWTWTGNTKEAE